MPQDNLESEFLDRLYGVAMEPERFTELVDVWHKRIELALAGGEFATESDLEHLTNHLLRADRLLDLAFSNHEAFPKPLVERLEAEPHPMVAFESDGTILALNQAAVRQYGNCEREPIGVLPFDEGTIELLGQLAGTGIGRADEMAARLLRASEREGDRPILLSLASWDTAGGRHVLVLKQVDFKWSDQLTGLIREAFELTDAETSVMRLMAEGLAPAAIAKQRDSSLATIRTQIRSIYEKTGTRGQGEFLRMALGLGSLDLVERDWLTGALRIAPSSKSDAHPRPHELRLFELSDGRIMEYASFGDPDGRACLFLHNEFFGPVWPAAGVRRAERLGLRIVTPLRPCYGRSSCVISPRGSHSQIIAQDCIELLNFLEIESVVPMCQMAGGITALELAQTYPERIAALALVAPLFPMDMPEDERQLGPFHRFLSNTIHRHPALLEFICRTGFAYHERVGTKRFLATFARDHAPDLELLDDQKVLADMVAGVKFCATNGYRGFFSDYRDLPQDPWDAFLTLDLPIVILLGDQVEELRNLPAVGLLQHHERSEAISAPGGAHYLHFSHPEVVAECAARAWERALSV